MSKLDEVTINRICKMYSEEHLSRVEISREIPCSAQTVSNILERAGLITVNHSLGSRGGTRRGKNKIVCPQCRATGHNAGAKFCYRRGADVRSNVTRAIEKIGFVGKYVAGTPNADEGMKLLNEIVTLLKEVE